MLKCVRFSTDPRVRAALAQMEGPAVSHAFLDLGVPQTASGGTAPALADKREDAVHPRLARTGCLALPLHQRAHVAAASGVAAGAFGVGQAHMSNDRLARLRASGLASLWRTSFRVCPELVYSFLTVSWRADFLAQAVVAPWRFLAGVLWRGVMSQADLQLLLARSNEVAGPVAAAQAALRRAGIQPDVNWDRWTDSAGRVLQDPLAQSRIQVQRWLLEALRHAQLRSAIARRPEFAGLAAGIDHWASVRWLRKALAQESTLAALRAVMTGSLVTQTLAQRWVPGGAECPFCRCGNESPWHRFWECAAWATLREQALAGWAVADLAALLPECTMVTGHLPVDPVLAGMLQAAESFRGFRARVRVAEVVYTDGSAVNPQDPLLRRAAWAATWYAEGQWWVVSSPCPGPQTVGRA